MNYILYLGPRGKGKAQVPRAKGKGKRRELQFDLDLTRDCQTARACERTKRNDFPVGLTPQPPIYRTHLGRLLCPKPPYLMIFKGFPIFRKTGEQPGSAPLYIPYLYRRLGGGEYNREIVSFRSHARTRGLAIPGQIQGKFPFAVFPFTFGCSI